MSLPSVAWLGAPPGAPTVASLKVAQADIHERDTELDLDPITVHKSAVVPLRRTGSS